jgi:hypothetical protein
MRSRKQRQTTDWNTHVERNNQWVTLLARRDMTMYEEWSAHVCDHGTVRRSIAHFDGFANSQA